MKRGFLYTLTYILITVVSAFGTIMINSGRSNNVVSSSGGTTIDSAMPVATPGEKVLNSIMSMGNTEVIAEIDLLQNDIVSRTVSANESRAITTNITKIQFLGSINIADLENIKVNGTAVITMFDNTMTLNISMFNNTLYVSNETLEIKLEAGSLIKILDILPLFGIEFSTDMDLASLDINALMANFADMKEEVFVDGSRALSLEMMDGFTIKFLTDSEYNVSGVVADELEFDNYKMVMNVGLASGAEEIVDPELDEEKEYVDVTNTLNIVDSVNEIMTNKKMHFDVTSSVGGGVYVEGAIDIDYSFEIGAYFDFDIYIDGVKNDLQFGYIDTNIYINLNDLRLMVKRDNLFDIYQDISDQVDITNMEASILFALAKYIPGFDFAKVLEGDISSFDIDNLLEFAKGEDNTLHITVYGEALNIEDNLYADIVLDEENQFQSFRVYGVNILDGELDLNVVYSDEVVLPSLSNKDYYDLRYLPEFISATTNTINKYKDATEVNFVIDSTVDVYGTKVDLDGELKIDFKNKNNVAVYLEMGATLLNKQFDMSIYYVDDMVYMALDNLKFSCDMSDLDDLIAVLEQYVSEEELAVVVAGAKEFVASSEIVEDLANSDIDAISLGSILSVSMTDSVLALAVSKDVVGTNQDVSIELGYGDYIESLYIRGIDIDNFDMTLGLQLVDNVNIENIIVSEYVSLTNLDTFVQTLINTVDEVYQSNAVVLDIDTTITVSGNDYLVTGTVAYEDGTIYFDISTMANREIKLYGYIVEGVIYIDIDGLKVKSDFQSIMAMVDRLGGVDYEIVGGMVSYLLPTIDVIGVLNGDISTLDLNVIKNIVLDNGNFSVTLNKDYLAVDKDIVVGITYSDVINSIYVKDVSIKGVDMNMGMSVSYDYSISKFDIEDYSDISSIYRLFEAIGGTIETLVEDKKVSLTINTNLMSECKVRGTIYVDYSQVDMNNIDIDDMVAYMSLDVILDSTYSIEVRLDNGYAYIKYNNLKVKLSVDSIEELVSYISDLTKLDEVDIDIDSLAVGTIFEELLRGEFDNLRLSLIKGLVVSNNSSHITLDKSIFGFDNDFMLSILYDNKINMVNILNVVNNGKSSSVNIGLNYIFTPSGYDKSSYFDISGIKHMTSAIVDTINYIKNNKKLALTVTDFILNIDSTTLKVNGTLYVDLANALKEEFDYANITAYLDLTINTYNSKLKDYDEYAHHIEVYYVANTIYLKYNSLAVSINVDSISNVADLIKKFEQLHNSINGIEDKEPIDIPAVIKSLLPEIDMDMDIDLSKLNFEVIKYLNVSNNSVSVVLDKNILGQEYDLEIDLLYSTLLDGITLYGVKVDNVSLSGEFGFDYNYIMPTLVLADYSNIDNLPNALGSTLNTAQEVVDDKHIAFKLQTELVYTEYTRNISNIITKETITVVELLDGSMAKFDWSQAYDEEQHVENGVAKVKKGFNIEKMSINAKFVAKVDTIKYNYINGVRDEATRTEVTNTHNIEITYINNVVYIKFDKMMAYIEGESIGNIINSVSSLLGMNVSTDSVDNLMNLVGSAMSTDMLSSARIEMLKELTVTGNSLGIVVDISGQTEDLDIESIPNVLDLDIYYDELGLTNLTINNLNIENIAVDAIDISLQEYTPIAVVDSTGYMKFSGIENLIDTLANTISYNEYSLSGNVSLKVEGLSINIAVPVSLDLKIIDNKPEVKLVMGPIPVITGVNDDAPYKVGNSVDGINPGENRILTIYFRDDMVYIYRSETVPAAFVRDRLYEKKTKVHFDTFMSDPFYYLLEYGMGFKSMVMDPINSSLNKERQNPMDYSNILTGFAIEDNTYKLQLNLTELTENTQIGKFDIGLVETTVDGKNVLGNITVDLQMPVAEGITLLLSSQDLSLNLGQNIDFSTDMYPHIENAKTDKEGGEYDAYNGEWVLASQRKFTINFVTNSSYTVPSIEGIAGSNIDIEPLADYYIDSDTYRTYYEFAGWYETVTFDEEFTDDVMPRRNTTLYARWIQHIEKYITISFEENGGAELAPLKVLEGSKLDLPVYLDLITVTTADSISTLQFEYWAVYNDNGDLVAYESEYAPNEDITLYAYWATVDVSTTHELKVYDNGAVIATRRLFKDSVISLSGNAKFNSTTKYYTYQNGSLVEYTSMIMPDNDFELHIKNMYTLTVISTLGKEINQSISLYQGDDISKYLLDQVESYYYDDGTKTERLVYTFGGYSANISMSDMNIMPNSNVRIEAQWTTKKLRYFDYSFSVSWVKPNSWQDNNSSFFGKITPIKSATKPIGGRELEGTIIKIGNYDAQCIYDYQGAGINKRYEFNVAYWDTQSGGNLYYSGLSMKNDDYTPVSEHELTDDTVFHAVWYMTNSYRP